MVQITRKKKQNKQTLDKSKFSQENVLKIAAETFKNPFIALTR